MPFVSLRSGVALAAALIAANAFAGARDDLTTFTKGLKGLDGQFSQQVFDANGKRKESSTGRVAMSAPRLFRWEYVKPYPQLIVADGKNVWVYDPGPAAGDQACAGRGGAEQPARGADRSVATRQGFRRDRSRQPKAAWTGCS